MLRGLLILALVSWSTHQAGNSAATAAPAINGGIAMAAAGTAFQEEFRAAYRSALWTMMVLRWCDRRWDRPVQTAKAEARLRAVSRQAIRRGLKRQMEQAADDNARQMAVMRLDVRCTGGFDRFHASAQRALTGVEQLMRRPRRAQPPGRSTLRLIRRSGAAQFAAAVPPAGARTNRCLATCRASSGRPAPVLSDGWR